jgi:hypothetical protein
VVVGVSVVEAARIPPGSGIIYLNNSVRCIRDWLYVCWTRSNRYVTGQGRRWINSISGDESGGFGDVTIAVNRGVLKSKTEGSLEPRWRDWCKCLPHHQGNSHPIPKRSRHGNHNLFLLSSESQIGKKRDVPVGSPLEITN